MRTPPFPPYVFSPSLPSTHPLPHPSNAHGKITMKSLAEQSAGKRMGPYRTMAQDIGNLAWDHRPTAPEFGPISHMKNFYDRSHLAVAGEAASVIPPRPRMR